VTCASACAPLVWLLAPAAAHGEGPPAAAIDSTAAAAPPASATPSFFDVNKYRADPNNPGAIRLPGTNVALYIGGFAQLDAISDLQVIGDPDKFAVASIPVGGGTGNTGFELSARQSRVFIESDAPWSVADLLAYVEVDFFDPQNQADLHIRHAFGAIGHPDGVRLVAGVTWTSFMDATVFPSQLDYAGPVGLVNVQQAQARLVVPFHNERAPDGAARGFELLLAVEAPDPQVTTPLNVQATGYSYWPDTITTLRWNHGHGHVLASALLRQVGVLPATGERASAIGYGGNVTGRLTGFWGKDEILWSVGGGRGLARYFAGSGGQSLDAFLQPNGELAVTSLAGGMLSYQHFFWHDRLSLTGIGSLLHLFNLQAGTDATLRQSLYVGGVLQYFPNRRFMTGIEYLFGQRENRNEQAGSDNRLQLSTQVRF
jgi:hypothetical protein